ncbi:hypothetical protein GGF42_001246 [Coemansia sp. RSA 2424]|nr:hypothetical protein GGF42_001246 [Coemansia sp. RSA 2424]
MVGIVGMYKFDYKYYRHSERVDSKQIRAAFETYLQSVHGEMHNEDLLSHCSQKKLSKEFVDSAAHRYKSITHGGTEPIFVAANLYNSEKVLPNMAAQLLSLADTLGHSQIFVSIYENGSNDKTKEILHQFNETLEAMGIAHRIVADATPKPKHVHRIEYLAKLRNYALEPLYSDGSKFGQVIFVNDYSLFCNDLWKKGFKHIVMVPRIKLTYTIDIRDLIRKPLYFPADTPSSDPELEKISFWPGPEKILCRPLNGVDSHHPDEPDTYVTP